jgi:protease-4
VLIIGGILVGLVLVVMLGIALLIMSVRDSQPDVHDNSVLVLKVEGVIPDYVNEDPFASRFFGAPSQSLTGLIGQLKKAKKDKRITAVLLDVDFVSMGWAKAEELREGIVDFKTSGKPIHAYMEYGADMEFYIAAACDKVYVAPVGDLFINGLAAEVMFFRGSLDKLGVFPDFYQIGKYKNAPDQFTRKEMSPEHREAMNSLLDEIFNRYVEQVARDRRKSPDEMRALIDNAPLSAKESQEAGLIDGAKYRDEVENELKKRLNYKEDDKLRLVKSSEYARVTAESLGINQGERIAVIYASGPIGSGQSNSGPFGEETIGSDTVSKAIKDASEDKSIKAIVLRVDSPGGTNYGSDIIWHAVEAAKRKKPVVASMSDVAASGGYYISTNASRIVAEPSTITGSIGIYAGKQVIKGFYDWIGISSEYLMRGKNAGMFRETEPFTDEERAKFQSMIKSAYYDEFLPKVAQGRGRDVGYIDSIAQGRVWSGGQAKERGLVDEFGGLERAVEVAKELAKIPREKDVRRVIFPAPRTFFQEIFGGGDDSGASLKTRQQRRAALSALPEDMRRALRYASYFEQVKRGEMMLMMPYEISVK